VPRLVEAFGEGCIVANNMSFTKRLPATLFRGDFAARFALKLAYKDFRLASELAAHHGVPTRLLDLCQSELLEAMNRGWGEEDRTKASTLQEERAGVALRLPPSATSTSRPRETLWNHGSQVRWSERVGERIR